MARCFVTRQLPGDALGRLAAEHEVDVWPGRRPPAPTELRDRAASADGLLCLLTDRIDAALLAGCPNLRAVSNLAVGCDNVDVEAVRARDIALGYTPDVLTETTADLAFALILAAARRLPEGVAAVREGEWLTWEPGWLLGRDVHGATLGIVGLGRIGRAVARRAEGFGMTVVHSSSNDGLPLPDLLAAADFVSLHCPLTPHTRHLIGAAALAAMKPTAILVNTARGAIVDQRALAAALHSLGDLELEAGEIGRAEHAYRDAIRRAHTLDAPRVVCYCLAGLSATAAERGDTSRSVRLWNVAVAVEQDLQFQLRKREMNESRVAALSESKGTDEKAPVGLDEAVAYALESRDY